MAVLIYVPTSSIQGLLSPTKPLPVLTLLCFLEESLSDWARWNPVGAWICISLMIKGGEFIFAPNIYWFRLRLSQHLRDRRVFLILVSASKAWLSFCFKMPMSGSGDVKAFVTGASEERKEPVSQKSYQRICTGLTQVLCLSLKQTLWLREDV